MGNLLTAAEIYRREPLKDLEGEYGGAEFYKYGACRVTGWRKEQEDKMVCLPKFYQDYSFFAVYDGHGGGDAAEYLCKYLHKHLIDSLKENPDEEMALYLAFLTCDLSLREITKQEYSEIIKNNKKCKLINSNRISRPISSMTKALAGPSGSNNGSNSIAASGSAAQNYDMPGASCPAEESDNMVKASGSVDDNVDLPRASDVDAVAGASGSENVDLPRASSSAEDAAAGASDSAKNDGTGASGSAEKKDDMIGDPGSAEETDEELLPRVKREVKRFIAQSKTVRDLFNAEDLDDEDEEDDADFTIDEEEMEEGSDSSCESESNESNSEESDDDSDSSTGDKAEIIETSPLIGSTCGSTATVVLFNQKTAYIANVGDSRCIASINGRAFVLSKDHSPEDSSELDRITKAGCKVKNGRINLGLNMSRSFGDFGLKKKKTAEAFQAVTCEPDIKVIDITNEMDFIVVASDGIWNAWDNQDVVDFIKEREMMDLEDICAEMFEALMPLDLTDDGTGCDNMTMIIVKFRQSMSPPNFLQKRSVVYRYPKEWGQLAKMTATFCTDSPNTHNSILC